MVVGKVLSSWSLFKIYNETDLSSSTSSLVSTFVLLQPNVQL
jgi:hypothetical protein